MVGGNNGQDGFSSVPFARQKIVVQPPTIFCRILHVLPSSTAPGCCWAVTVADRQGAAMTVDIDARNCRLTSAFKRHCYGKPEVPSAISPWNLRQPLGRIFPLLCWTLQLRQGKDPPRIRLCVHHTPETMFRHLCQLPHLLLRAEQAQVEQGAKAVLDTVVALAGENTPQPHNSCGSERAVQDRSEAGFKLPLSR
jgi:hypothetical protein